MKVGGFPSREAALREEMERRRRVSRRALLGASTAFLAGGFLAGLGVGAFSFAPAETPSSPGQSRSPVSNPMHAWARGLAGGDLADLLKNRDLFVSVLEPNRSDDLLWSGFQRLALSAITSADDSGRRLASRLLVCVDSGAHPAYVKPLIDHLRERAEMK